MNINSISFKGVKIGQNINSKITQKKDKKYREGFYQVANFLDEQRGYDFEIKKPKFKQATISSKIGATQEQVALINIPMRYFKNPKKIIKVLGSAINHGSKAGQEKWIKNFERYTKLNSSNQNNTNASNCNIEAILTSPEIFNFPEDGGSSNYNSKEMAINSENYRKAGILLSENIRFCDDTTAKAIKIYKN